jgi:ubiquitin-activating enzyme E1
MMQLNGREFSVRVTGPYTFELDVDASGFQPYQRSGYINQVKQPATHSFKPLQEALSNPGEFVLADFAKMERPGLLHIAFQALHQFTQRHNGQLPASGNAAHADEVLSLAKALNEASTGFKVEAEVLEKEGEVVRKLALGARGVLNPMAALFGGIVGQEVLKACSGKFSPIKQWFYFDAVEALPDAPLSEDEVGPLNCRYDGQIAVFGKAMQATLADQAFFLVGAGAIGCEMLKNWAMMGLGSGEQGAIHVTDMDRIEKSNLSRQFLFRPNDIGAAKSVVAARAAGQMNAALKVCAYESRVGGDTEVTFNDDFYDKLTGVCTALDNVDARLYMDQRCLFYKLPMLESGTLGTKGNTQVVVPHLTENYGATRDPPEKSIPVCTLKNFPNQIEHTLQWARDWFEGAFKQAPDDATQYLTNPTFLDHLKTQQNTKLETLKRIHDSLVAHRPASFEDCVTWARLRFDELFNHIIRQLLHNFPVDQV